MSEDKWKQAQQKEMESWLETDMTYDYLMKNWEERKEDFRPIVERLNPESSIIDIGSGPVSVLHSFPSYRKMIAIDPLNDKYSSKYKRLPSIEYISSKAEKLDFQDNSFDAVVCVNALDHMDDYLQSLEEMMRCLKPGGLLYLEYENTSPLSVFFAKLGYKKPLDDFHPILVQNKYVFRALKDNNFVIGKVYIRPQFSFKKVAAIVKILLGKKEVSSYEQKISSTNYGMIRMFVHYMIIATERLLFFYWPKKYGYFTTVIAQKRSVLSGEFN
jgi:ubiquinone/menaquinone biosynthesis C-methylase UbiE